MTKPSALDGLDQVREHSFQKKAGGLADRPQDPKVLRPRGPAVDLQAGREVIE